MIRTTIGTVLAALMCWGSADGQTADSHPAFEVASVKPAPPYVDGADYQMGSSEEIVGGLRLGQFAK